MQQHRFFRSLLLLVFLNLLVKPFWLLGIDRTVQNVAGTEEYGLYFTLYSLSFYLLILLDPGLHTFNNRAIAQNPNLFSKYLASFVPLKILLSVSYIVTTFVLALFLGFGERALVLLGWIGLVQVLSSLLLYFRSNLAGLHLFKIDSFFSVVDRLLMILICGVLLWGPWQQGKFKIEWFVYAQITALGVSCLAAWLILQYRKTAKVSFRLKLPMLRVVLRKSLPFALLAILMTLYSRIDSLMLERLLPNGAYFAGIYAQAFRLLEAASMIAFLFSTLLLPMFSSKIAKKEEVADLVQPMFFLLMVPAFLLTVASFTYRNEIMHLLYTDSTQNSGTVFGWLMWAFPAQCLVYLYGTLLTAKGDLRFLNILALAGVVGNVVLNFLLIPQYQVLGAVVASVATQAVVGLLQAFRAHRLFLLNWHLHDIWRLLTFVAVTVLLFVFSTHLSWPWPVTLAVLCVFSLTFAVIIRLLRPQWLFRAVQNKSE